jgi:hypothetical protein
MPLFEEVKSISTADVFAAFFPGSELRRDGQIHATLCIFHKEKTPSLKIYQNRFKCFGCGTAGSNIDLVLKAKLASSAIEAAKLIARKFGIKFEDKKKKGRGGSRNTGTVEHLTVAKLAEWKKLDEKLLRDAGLRNAPQGVIIPYLTVSGELYSLRYRLNTEKEPRFRWASGSRLCLYGLDRMGSIKKAGWTLLVEGESDSWTCWSYDLPALGIPGKTTWKSEWAADLAGVTVFLWQEPEAEDLTFRLLPDIPDLYIIEAPDGIKDISEAHLQGKDVVALIEQLKKNAIPGEDLFISEREAKLAKLKRKASKVLAVDDPLTLIKEGIRALGYGGNIATPLIVYLAATTRLLKMRRGNMPCHLQLLAVPSAGKSYAIIIVLCLLPPESWHRIDAGSPRVLIYDDANLAHKVLLFDEIDSLPRDEDNPAASALRNLLQEHHLKYAVVVHDPSSKKYVTQQVEKPGPTCLLTTGIKRTESQLDSRLLCIEVPEDVEQITAALTMQAQIEINGVEDPSAELPAFQSYLQALVPWDVVVPFAPQLAARITRVAINSRINRDFARLLSLVKATAIIRHVHRHKDQRGRLVATIDDYRTVYDLVKSHYAAAVSGASEAVRQVVAAVAKLRDSSITDPVTVSLVARNLKICKSSASRRINTALDNGWLIDKSEKTKGKSYNLHVGEALPDDETGLPDPSLLTECSTVPPDSQGDRGDERVYDDNGRLLDGPNPKTGRSGYEPEGWEEIT